MTKRLFTVDFLGKISNLVSKSFLKSRTWSRDLTSKVSNSGASLQKILGGKNFRAAKDTQCVILNTSQYHFRQCYKVQSKNLGGGQLPPPPCPPSNDGPDRSGHPFRREELLKGTSLNITI